MIQPPLTAAKRPDLTRLPAYVEPPPKVTRVDNRRNSVFAILLIALSAGICGGIALNEVKQNSSAANTPVQDVAAALPAPAAPQTTRYADVPLPAAVQPVRQPVMAAPTENPPHVAVSHHPGTEHNRAQPSRPKRPSNGYAGSL